MKQLLRSLMFLCLVVSMPVADSVDLSDGVFIAHHPLGLVYTTGDNYVQRYDSEFQLLDVSNQNCRIQCEIGQARVWYIVAAFAEAKEWCAVDLGLGEYNESHFAIVDHGPGVSNTLRRYAGGWPGSESGISIYTTDASWSGQTALIYYFGGYVYGETVIPIVNNPKEEILGFISCEERSTDFAAYAGGAMGILTEGVKVYPPGMPDPVVCCSEGNCLLLQPAECAEIEGTLHETLFNCDSYPCIGDPPPPATQKTSWGEIKASYK